MATRPTRRDRSEVATLLFRPALETLEERATPTTDPFRSIDGSDNNLGDPDLGMAGTPLLRLASTGYADGTDSPRADSRTSGPLPSARAISNAVHSQASLIPSAFHLSGWVFQWGQFVDHDIGLSEPNAGFATGAETGLVGNEPFPIMVPAGDPAFDPSGSGTRTIPLTRSMAQAPTQATTGRREQLNVLTSFLDGSMVYGSDDVRANNLRSGVGGRLLTSSGPDGDLLPFNTFGEENANALRLPEQSLFLAGDVRANEQAGLTAVHTLFVREHNRIAHQIAAIDFAGQNLADPTIDEAIYQRARRQVVALIQRITYEEFLPAILGPNALPAYSGYRPGVNPALATEFSTAAFRVGHTMLPPELLRVDPAGHPIAQGSLKLRDAFFNTDAITSIGIDTYLLGLALNTQQEIDRFVIDDVRNFLFGPPGAGGFDLAALNIQRGRDHGLPSYNDVREAYGLPRVASFADITSDPAAQAALASVYASVDDIDVWTGGLAEEHFPGSQLGETFRAIWIDQFLRLRDGDRFFYLNQAVSGLSNEELSQIQGTTLGDVIRRNSGIVFLPNNVFVVPGGKKVSQNQMAQFSVSGGAPGPNRVEIHNADGSLAFGIDPFPGFDGQVRTAVADVNGDGVPDLIAGTGPGTRSLVRVIDGSTREELFRIEPFESSFTGGVFVAAGDLNGDGFADIAITPDLGGSARVRIFSGNRFAQLNDFIGIDDPNFRGGARVTFGDVDGDGKADLLIAAGQGGGPRVAGFNGLSVASGTTAPIKLFSDFFILEDTFRLGVFIASGDINGDGFAEVIVGSGPGGGPHVFALSGADLVASGGINRVQLANFFAGDSDSRDGVCLTVKDLDGDSWADLVTGAGAGSSTRIVGYAGSGITPNGTPTEMFAFDAFPDSVFVG